MNRLTQLKSLRAQKLVKPGITQKDLCISCWGWKMMGYTYNLSGINRYFESEGPCYRCDNAKFLAWQTEKKALNVDCMNSFRGSPPVPRQTAILAVEALSQLEQNMRLYSTPPLVINANQQPDGVTSYGWTVNWNPDTGEITGSR